MNTARSLVLTVLSASILSTAALAQEPKATPAPGNNNSNRGGDRGGRGNFDPAEMRKRYEEGLKTSLKASDEEWTVLQPLIENVVTKQMTGMGSRLGGMRGMFGNRGGGDNNNNGGGNNNGGNANATPRPGREQSDALQETLKNESASPEEIKAKLAAVRDLRKKSTAELNQAREELRKVLTVRQEAVLVAYGVLE